MPRSRIVARVSAAIPGGAIVLALAGCGADQSQLVQAKVQQYAHAVAARQPATLCRQVLAPSLVARLTAVTGLSCAQAMTTYVDSVTDPTLSISTVTVTGNRASAVVLAGARGQSASLGTMHLIRAASGWRIDALTRSS